MMCDVSDAETDGKESKAQRSVNTLRSEWERWFNMTVMLSLNIYECFSCFVLFLLSSNAYFMLCFVV